MKIRNLRQYLGLINLGGRTPRIMVKVGGGCFAERSQITADPARLDAIVKWLIHVSREAQNGPWEIVVVVSAPGGKTDHLIAELHKRTQHPTEAAYAKAVCQGETDMARELEAAINQKLSRDAAQSFSASQMGLMAHSKTKAILKLKDAERMSSTLRSGVIVVCAGFQALNESGHIMDLGRGGSDASAVAIAAALGCELCIFLKDVPRVYVAPPNLVPNAKSLTFASYSLMHSLASTGSKVIMARAVSFAASHGLPCLVALCPGFPGADEQTEGTLIWKRQLGHSWLEEPNGEVQLGLGVVSNLGTFTMSGIPNIPGTIGRIFGAVGDVVIGEVAQGVGDRPSITFSISQTDAAKTERALNALTGEQPGWKVERLDGLAALTLIGAPISDGSGYLARFTQCLGAAKINIEMLTTTEHGITVVMNEDKLQRAAQALAEEFDLLQT